MTKLSLALAAAILIGCGSEGAKAADKAPFEIKTDYRGLMTITSLEDGLKIYSIIVNRGNCEVSWTVEDNKNDINFRTGKGNGNPEGGSNVYVWTTTESGIKNIETIPMKDFYDKYGTDKALGLNFGEKDTVNAFCNPLEAQVDTDKGSWTFSFR
jgi:lipoprotein